LKNFLKIEKKISEYLLNNTNLLMKLKMEFFL
jgi:hypothetical protein